MVPIKLLPLAPPTNVVGNEVAAIVGKLPPGIYRAHLTVCRISLDAQGLETGSTLVNQNCFDFEAKKRAIEAPAAEPEPKVTP